MASRVRSSLSSTQPRLHGACLLPGHILVNERFHGSPIVKALQGWWLFSISLSVCNKTGRTRQNFQNLGPVYMVSVTRDSPPSRDNFTERLCENCVTETKLTLLNYAYIVRRIIRIKIRIIIYPSFFLVRFY